MKPPLLLLLLWSSCTCFGPTARSRPECVAVNAAIDCSVAALQEKVTAVKPAVAHILATRPDAPVLLGGLKNLGLDVLACAIAEISKELFSRAGASPEAAPIASRVSESARAWMTLNLPGVRVVNLP